MASAIATAVGRPSAAGRIGTLSDTPYLGVMYIGLMIAAVIVAFGLLHTGRPIAWAAAGTLAGLTSIGFVLSRTTGLPSAIDDVGNWKEGLGLASMFVETGSSCSARTRCRSPAANNGLACTSPCAALWQRAAGASSRSAETAGRRR